MASREESSGRWSCRPVKDRHDRMRHAETRDQATDLVAADEHVDTEALGDLGDSISIGQSSEGFAARLQRSGDHEIALGEEETGPGVVALVGPSGEPTLTQPEDGETFVVDRLDPNERQRSPRGQKW